MEELRDYLWLKKTNNVKWVNIPHGEKEWKKAIERYRRESC